MSVMYRVVILSVCLLLTAVFVVPLWQIGLIAPQYPEGLYLHIWTDRIAGDVRTINTLNHYIGMGKVEPDKIPELRWFPFLFSLFISTGLLVAAFNKRWMIQGWCLGLITFACCGLYDFYLWEYRYGHEISEDAPMKIEESYQPPLIGTKQILTITASSWPDKGGYAFTVAAVISSLVLLSTMVRRNAA